MQLDQIKAVVTGGASGLGFAVAKHLVAHGAKVALLDVNDELARRRALAGEADVKLVITKSDAHYESPALPLDLL